MDEQRALVVNRIVTDGWCSTELYCRVYDTLLRCGYSVDGLLNPCSDAYRLRFECGSHGVRNPSEDALLTILETYPLNVLIDVANDFETQDNMTCDTFDEPEEDPGYDSY